LFFERLRGRVNFPGLLETSEVKKTCEVYQTWEV